VMALRFNKRVKIAPGVRVNLGLKGVSTTIGPKGASVNFGKKGVHLNAGIPGTGISTRTKIGSGKKPLSSPVETQVSAANAEISAGNGRWIVLAVSVLVIGLLVWIS
jgi:hypothetical protein